MNNNIAKNIKKEAARIKKNNVIKYNCIKTASKKQILDYSLAADNYHKNKVPRLYSLQYTKDYKEIKYVKKDGSTGTKKVLVTARNFPNYTIEKMSHYDLTMGYVNRKLTSSIEKLKTEHPDYPIPPMYVQTHRKHIQELVENYRKLRHRTIEKKKSLSGGYYKVVFFENEDARKINDEIKKLSDEEINLLYKQMTMSACKNVQGNSFITPTFFLYDVPKKKKISEYKKLGKERMRIHLKIKELQNRKKNAIKIYKIVTGTNIGEQCSKLFDDLRETNKNIMLDVFYVKDNENKFICRYITSDKELEKDGIKKNNFNFENFNHTTALGVAA